MCHLLRDLCLRKDPYHDPSVHLVLGFRCITPNVFQLLPGSAIERSALSKKTPFISGDTSGRLLVSKEVLRNLLERCLSGSLGRRVFEAISIFRSGPERTKNKFATLEPLLYMALLLDDTRQLVAVKPEDVEEGKRCVPVVVFMIRIYQWCYFRIPAIYFGIFIV